MATPRNTLRRWRMVPLAAAPILLAAMGSAIDSRFSLAQAPAAAPAFEVPSSLPKDTGVKLDGSSSMSVINEALKKRFEEKFPGTTFSLGTSGTDAALKALQDGRIDLAAVGRALTNAEKAQQLKEVPISREKIAIIVGSENPFKGNLTFEQFAKIFRGEITDWSQVGGAPGPIRFIDRPEFSDTRQAFSRYPVFQKAPFRTGATATLVPEDDTAQVVKQLGKDGISYAIASQIATQPNVQALPMHGTLPTDPRYPYSQPRGYVYKGDPNPAVQAFLGFATSAPGQEIVKQAKAQEAETVKQEAAAPAPAPSPEAAMSPSPVASPEPIATRPADLSRLWWLLLPLLGLPLLLWWAKGRGAAVPPVAVARPRTGRIVLTPRNCRDAYAYWEVPDEELQAARQQGGRDLKLRLYDVTDIPDMDRQKPHRMQEYECADRDFDKHLPITRDDRDYVAELGYVTNDGHWLKVARSSHVRVPACTPTERDGLKTAAAAVGGAALATGAVAAARTVIPAAGRAVEQGSRIILVPRNERDGYAYWEVSEADKARLRQQGGRDLKLRIHDVTDIDLDQQSAHSVRQYECDEQASDLHVPIPEADRDYVAELGYTTDNHQWLSLAKSAAVRFPNQVVAAPASLNPVESAAKAVASDLATARPTEAKADMPNLIGSRIGDSARSTTNLLGNATKTASDLAEDATKKAGAVLAGGAAALTGATAAARSLFDRDQENDRGAEVESDIARDCRIILVPRNERDAYAYWEVSDNYKQFIRDQGGQDLTLRIHDSTNLDIDYEPPHSTQEYPCRETDQDRHVSIPVPDRDYIAELGYYTADRHWLRLIRSFHVRVPANS